MTPNLMEWVRINRPAYAGNVLEIGSLDVNGNVRQFFTDALSYTGIDIVYGNGVDICLSSHNIVNYFVDRKFDTIICLETIEHDYDFFETCDNIRFVLAENAHVLLSSPTIGFPVHHQPDYWRFTESGIRKVMDHCGTKVLKLESLPDTVGNHSIIALGVAL